VTGTLKHWLKSKLKEEDFKVIDKILKEETETGDIEKYEQPLGHVMVRRPDGVAHDGNPFFNIEDEVVMSKLLDGKKKNEHWKNLILDKGIHSWANKNFLKSFHIKTKDGLLIKMR
jgi:Zn-dependent M16 (insulinase) family peptidase